MSKKQVGFLVVVLDNKLCASHVFLLENACSLLDLLSRLLCLRMISLSLCRLWSGLKLTPLDYEIGDRLLSSQVRQQTLSVLLV